MAGRAGACRPVRGDTVMAAAVVVDDLADREGPGAYMFTVNRSMTEDPAPDVITVEPLVTEQLLSKSGQLPD